MKKADISTCDLEELAQEQARLRDSVLKALPIKLKAIG